MSEKVTEGQADKPKTQEYLLIQSADWFSLRSMANQLANQGSSIIELNDIVAALRAVLSRSNAYKCRIVCAEHPREE